MNQAAVKHPARDELQAFGLGRLDPHRQAEVERHVADCQQCCNQLRAIPDDTLLGRLRSDTTRFPAQDPEENAVTIDLVTIPSASAEVRVPKDLAEHPRYRILRQLGAGGMGVVYQAEHRLMERPVALKVINRELTSNPLAVQRFRQEVKNAARLNHPHIVTAFDAEQAGDLHFLVMEYIDGRNLAQHVARHGPLPVDKACLCARQAALGLQHAFEKGMVHRDIKPQNLILERNRYVKILDFGLARFASERESSGMDLGRGGASSSGALTTVGATLGTPDYIAPEQIGNAREAGIQADIYSLGCTLYFLLAGQPPFPHGSTLDKLTAHRSQSPAPLSGVRSDIPPELTAILDRMMAKEPAERYATPAEAAQALAPFCKSSGAAPVAPALISKADGNLTPLAAAADSNGLTDLRELNLTDLPGDLPPLPSAQGSAPARPNSSRQSGSVDQTAAFFRRNRSAATLIGAAAIVGILACVLYSAMHGDGDDPREQGTRLAAQSSPAGGAAASQPWSPPLDPFEPAGSGNTSETSQRWRKSAAESPAGATPRLLMVIPHDDFWYADYANVAYACDKFGLANTTVASSSLSPAKPSPNSRFGAKEINPEVLLAKANPDDYDAVIFCGANPVSSIEFLREGAHYEEAKRFITAMLDRGKFVLGICAGNAVLADAGALKGKRAAANRYIPQDVLDRSGAQWVEKQDQWTQFVTAGHIITGHDEASAKQLMTELADQFSRGSRGSP